MSRNNRFGLVVLGLLSLGDLFAPLWSDGEHPPMSVAVGLSALGLVSLLLVVLAWRGTRWSMIPLIVLRLASAFLAVPAFFVADVPAVGVVTAGITVAATLFGVVASLLPARVPARA